MFMCQGVAAGLRVRVCVCDIDGLSPGSCMWPDGVLEQEEKVAR
jgi:hypothetical protein